MTCFLVGGYIIATKSKLRRNLQADWSVYHGRVCIELSLYWVTLKELDRAGFEKSLSFMGPDPF